MIPKMFLKNSKKSLIQHHGGLLRIQMLKMTERSMILLIQLDKQRLSLGMQRKIELGMKIQVGTITVITANLDHNKLMKQQCMLKMDQKVKVQNILIGGRD